MRQVLARLGMAVAIAVGLLGGVSARSASADAEWYDCYVPGVYWRFSGGIWRYGFHDRPLVGVSKRNRSPYDPPNGCGAFPSEDGRGVRDRFDSPYGEPRRSGGPRLDGGSRLSDGDSEHIHACMLRYRTYDSRSDSFVGKDGRRHVCRF